MGPDWRWLARLDRWTTATSERTVKAAVRRALVQVGDKIWYDMPVPYGFGRSTVDFLVCAGGRMLAVECKRPGERPTARQLQTMAAVRAAGGRTIVVDRGCRVADLARTLIDLSHARPPQDGTPA